jgi:hydrogenase nickel incorporation protein HypA/HybF
MHEMSLAEGILRLVEDVARQEAARRVASVTLEIGALACVEIEALRFCFDAVTRDTLAAAARLEIRVLPGQGWCMLCAQSAPLAALTAPCPQCGSFQVQPVSGMEMRVKEIEIE